MSKALTPERVDTAAAPAAAGDGVRGKRRARRLRDIDFSRPTKFTQEQLRRIERAHEGFCRTAAMRLGGEARTEMELEVVDLGQVGRAAHDPRPAPSGVQARGTQAPLHA